MARQTFPVIVRKPRIVVRYVDGNLVVRSWDKAEIGVETAEPMTGLRQEEDTLTITDYKGDIALWVPAIKGSFFSSFPRIKTSIIVANLSRSVTVEEVYNVELREVGGQAVLERMHGNVEMTAVQEGAEITVIGGNLRATHMPKLRVYRGIGGNVTLAAMKQVELDSVGGNLSAERIETALHVSKVGGNGHVYECPGAEIAVNVVGGNLRVDSASLMLSSMVGGNLDVYAGFPAGSQTHLRGGGNATVVLPGDADVSVHGMAGGNISTPWLKRSGGGFVNLVYGNGQARLDVAVGGNLRLQGDAIPRNL